MDKIKIHCSYDKMVKVDSLIEHERNDNTHKLEDAELLAGFMKKKGIRHPIIVSNLSGKIVAGHLRKWAAMINGAEEYPVDYQDFKDELDEYEFLSGDNNLSRYAEFDNIKMLDNLKELGIDSNEFDFERLGLLDFEVGVEEKDGEKQGGIEFSEFLNESNNYVVLFFKNDMDWLNARSHFDLETVSSKRANGQPWSRGIGRVLDGAKYINRLNDENF